jgi:hypothetical protein
MVEQLRSIVETTRALRGRNPFVLGIAGSQAAAELDARASRGADTKGLTEAFVQGLKAIAAAEDFIGAAVDFGDRPDRSFSTMAVMRGAAEACAQSFWYLDPGIDADTRDARAIGGLRKALGAADSFVRKGELTLGSDTTSALDDLRDVVNTHPGPLNPDNMERLIRGLGATGEIDQRYADAGYGALSNATHSQKDARDQIIIGWDDDGDPVLQPHLGTEYVLWYVASLYGLAVFQAARLLGWDTDEWLGEAILQGDQLERLLNEVVAEHIDPDDDAQKRS